MKTIEISQGIWQINEAGTVDAYLLVGAKRALLVDALHQEKGLYAQLRKITRLPVDVVITHGHSDHAGASVKELRDNGCILYMDRRDIPILKDMVGDGIEAEWFTDISGGAIFDLGGFTLEVISVPGHTPGSLVLLEREKQIMFTGDTIGSGNFWMQLPHSLDLAVFLSNLDRLWAQLDKMDSLIIYPGHRNQSPIDLNLQYVEDTHTITKRLVSGEWAGKYGEMDYLGMHMKFMEISYGLMRSYLYASKV